MNDDVDVAGFIHTRLQFDDLDGSQFSGADTPCLVERSISLSQGSVFMRMFKL